MNSSTFQLVVSGVFILFLLGGVAAFALFSSGGGPGAAGVVEVWGMVDSATVERWLTEVRQSGNTALDEVRYTQVPAASYEATVVNAMAAGRGPDLFLVTNETLVTFVDKILPIPYGSYSQSTYLSSFVDEATLFLGGQGAFALPIIIDPLVMYVNRDLLARAGVAQTPALWSDLLLIAPKLTSLDAGQVVRRSAVAMGTWRNTTYAKPILSTLMLQAGESIVTQSSGGLAATLGNATSGESPAASALRFYTEFANPQKVTYSWNASLPNSTNAFLAGDVAIYFGFASEVGQLRERNPNLQFEVHPVPQLRDSAATYGRITGLAVALGARNPEGAAAAAGHLSGRDAVTLLSSISPLPPVRRDVAVDTAGSAATETFVRSSLIARGWLDPHPAKSDQVFKVMIESVLSGAADPISAVSTAGVELQAIIAGEPI